ncbi:MAG: sporulation integral membrane protein YtvI [Oscillospiraceae bacterium]|jgi:sporulation integral membrane protein YtvI|nr:sporulation integral membrane protein YtvI [Oscillospiraceae bacterium]
MKKPWRILAYVLGGALAVWLSAKFLLPVGLPFLLGFGVSKLAEPFVRRLSSNSRFPRWLACFLCVSAVFALVGLLLFLLGRTLFGQMSNLAQQLPSLLSSLSDPLAKLHAQLLHLAARLPDGFAKAAAQWIDSFFAGSTVIADSLSQGLLDIVTGTISILPDFVLFTLTALLSGYLFSAELPSLREAAKKNLPESWQKNSVNIWKRLKSALGGYCKAQLRLLGVTFVIVSLGLVMLRVDSALLVGLAVAIVDALPVFGSGTILIPWAVIALAQGNNLLSVGLLLVYATASITRTLLEPRFLGKQIGLSPLFTLLALYAGWRLFGILGMILLPVAVILCKQLYDIVETARVTEKA